MASTPNEIIRAGRIRECSREPYLAPGLWTMAIKEDEKCVCPVSGMPTMGVSKSWVLYYHPDVAKWPLDALETVWCHEVWHLLRGHAERALAVGVLTREDAVLWNIAADCEINDGLVASGYKFPPGLTPCTPRAYGFEDGLTAEEYYDKLRKMAQQQQAPGTGGSGSDGQTRPWEDGNGDQAPQGQGKQSGKGQAPVKRAVPAELIRKDVAEKIGQAQGDIPGGVRRWAKSVLKTKSIPWETIFKSVMGRIITAGRREDYSFSVPSRRGDLPGGFMLPGQQGALPLVVGAVDTSGSMAPEMLTKAVAVLEDVLTYLGKTDPITIIAGDACVESTKSVLSAHNIELTGGGGTDMRQLINHALDLRPCPQIIVLVTDCLTPWHETHPNPSVQLVVVNVGGGTAPDYATEVKAHPEEEEEE